MVEHEGAAGGVGAGEGLGDGEGGVEGGRVSAQAGNRRAERLPVLARGAEGVQPACAASECPGGAEAGAGGRSRGSVRAQGQGQTQDSG